MVLARALLVLLVALSSVAAVVGQFSNCPAGDTNVGSCVEIVTTQPSGDKISLQLSYDISTHTICTIFGGLIQTPANVFVSLGLQAPSSGSTITVNTLTGGAIEATNIQIGFTAGGSTGTLGSSTANALVSGYGTMASLVYSGGGITVNEQVTSATAATDSCTADTFGDPHFSGFFGQQFCVFGHADGVLNIIGDNNFQLNARLQALAAGQAMTESQMRLVRLVDNSLPATRWFDHDGTYMTELGLALLDGHHLYGKAGEYKSGWATMQFDDVEMTVGEKRVVGQGSEAVTLTRVDTHRIFLETRFVSVYITNADNFFNVEHAKTTRNFKWADHPLSGALGKTANPAFKPHQGEQTQDQMEKDAAVESNNLFEITALVNSL